MVNRKGEILTYQSIPTGPGSDYKLFFKKLANEIKNQILTLNSSVNLEGVSIGAPTGSYRHGKIERAVNLNWPDHLPVAKILGENFNVPVIVSNDANAAAFGEMYFGSDKGVKNLICITLGTGLGCGLITAGNLIMGSGGHAGELGHVTAIPDGRKCTCGREGCLETYVSATGMVRTVQEMGEEKLKNSILNQKPLQEITSKDIAEAALQGDIVAKEIFEFTGKIFGRTLADVVALLNPEVIVITGGVAKAGDLLIKPTRHYLNHYLLDMYRGTVEVKVSESVDKRTPILGAAAFMWDKLKDLRKTTI